MEESAHIQQTSLKDNHQSTSPDLSSLQSLKLDDDYNQPLSVGVLPSSLQSLVFGYYYNQPLSVGVLPSSLQSLEFGDIDYNQALSVGVLPSSLQSLVFGANYNQPLPVGVLPASLQSLTFGWYYNLPLPAGVLPSLQSLVFGIEYNQPLSVGVLPTSLQSLVFGYEYNQALSVGVLPTSLQSLVFGWNYNQPLSVGVLPTSLQSLVFSIEYNQPLSVGVLPTSLQSLKFRGEYNQPLPVGVLPTSLQSLVFGKDWSIRYNQPLSVGVLPSSLQSLVFGWNYNQPLSVGVLPSSLQSLVFGDDYDQPLSVGVLPSSLQSLRFGDYYNQPLSVGVLPSSLQSLRFGDYYNQPLPVGVLPTSLQSLVFGIRYNQPLSVGVLPSSLQSLRFGDYYNQPLSVGVLPSSLQSLKFGDYYNQPLSVGVLPSSLQSLVFGIEYNQPLSVGVLPSSLQSLVFGIRYNQPLSVGVLPSSLQSLKFGDYYNQPLSVGVLPSSLQSLVFGIEYNQPLSVGVLPSSLQSLVFGNRYNQAISVGVLPTSLHTLKFRGEYNQPLLVGVLPTSLQSLIFCADLGSNPLRLFVDFNQSISVVRNFIKLGSYGLIKLSKAVHLILSATSPSKQPIAILNNNNQQITFNSNPNCISFDSTQIYAYPITDFIDSKGVQAYPITNFISVNNKKYFKLHTFPYSANQVILVMCESSSELYVYKEIDYSNNPKIYDQVQFEITTMKLFIGDDMFVQYKDHQDDTHSKKIYLLTHFCEGGDLEQLFQSIYKWNESKKEYKPYTEYKYISESDIWRHIQRLFQILEKLSLHNLAHLDIKPLNLFIGHDGQIVLGDFGCCHYFNKQNQSAPHPPTLNPTSENQDNSGTVDQTAQYISMIAATLASRGTHGYYSPESKQKIYYASNDIYSVGSTLFHLLSCHPDDIEKRREFIKNHKNNSFDADHIKISTDRYSPNLINFVKNLLTATPQDRLSLDDLKGQIINEHTQRITSFFINQQQILSNTTTLILDGEFNSLLKGLPPKKLLKLSLLGKFDQPIGWSDIPDSVETLIFGSSFNSEIKSFPMTLKILVLGKSFNRTLPIPQLAPTIHITRDREFSKYGHFISHQLHNIWLIPKVFKDWTPDQMKSVNIYRCNDSDQVTISSFIKTNVRESNLMLTIGDKCYGVGEVERNNNMLVWKFADTKLSINLEDVKVISHVRASTHPHLFCQIDKLKFEEINPQFGDCQPESEFPVKGMKKLFELDEDNIHQEFEHNHQYLNIRLIYIKPSTLSNLKWMFNYGWDLIFTPN
ncbi:putative calmodulin-binding protein [Cavenderia fasciculata]|uniref:Calmodulin-binding protein n=1 Tax=Cavenderia fasciculata TaxID=261658 RepID=F4PYG4_CACFS|nr:putative calmodulin-binding protein [Cavenderia fasciculata]EGG19230.1 putative calmodulin-binding protein [Cavenderia fasciculata]|eukprot:XP_004357501.1 putative calmodulin-binding protein [Cavenderia fasciculata]